MRVNDYFYSLNQKVDFLPYSGVASQRMEAVQSFNHEMTSLYEVKPPISKAKMTAITKSAIRNDNNNL